MSNYCVYYKNINMSLNLVTFDSIITLLHFSKYLYFFMSQKYINTRVNVIKFYYTRHVANLVTYHLDITKIMSLHNSFVLV